MMSANTASWLEIAVAIVNILGIGAAGWMLRATKRRHDAVLKEPGSDPSGPRIIAAWRHFRADGAKVAYHVASLVYIVWGMTMPETASPYIIVGTWVDLLVSAMFLACSVFDVHWDDRLAPLLGRRPVPSFRGNVRNDPTITSGGP